MLISTKGRYALRVMADLAANDPADGSFVPLRDVAERQGISQKYLESIFSLLSRAGFVTAVRGKGGGYRLSRAPEEYTAAQIVSLGDDLAPVACLGQNAAECPRKDGCVTLPLWQLLNRRIQKTLEEVTLADLLSGDIPTE